jgi:putative ABC transport system ATP-binding protein
MALIRDSCREVGAALLLVTHDRQILSEFEQTVDLRYINRAVAPQEAAT